MKYKFKVGDKVRAVKDNTNSGLYEDAIGQVYVVQARGRYDGTSFYTIRNDEDWDEDELELYQDEVETFFNKLKKEIEAEQ